MDMGAGRLPGRTDKADDLTLPDAFPYFDTLGERRHMSVSRLVSVVVLDLDVFAVAAFPARGFDHAVAGGENRRAVGGRPIDAGVHLDVTEDRMAAAAEARAHDGVVDRLADQEFLRAFAGLVIVIDHRVVRGLEAVIFLGFAADRERSKKNFGFVAVGAAVVFAGEEDVERIARLHLALEVDVVGIDPDHVLDHVLRHLVAQRGLVNALIEANPASVIVVIVAIVVGGVGGGVQARYIDGDVFAEIGQRRYRFDRGIIGDDDAVGLKPLAGTGRRHQDTKLLAFLQAAVAAAGAERDGNRFGFLRRCALLAQDRDDAIALLHGMNAFAGRVAAGDLVLGLRQQRDIFGHHAGFKTGIGVGGNAAFGGIGQFKAVLHAADIRGGVGERCIFGSAAAAPVRGIAHPQHDLVERDHRGELGLGQDRHEVFGDEGDFGIGLGGIEISGIVGG